MKEPGERGTLSIDDRVVEKVAGHAVSLVPGASAAPRRFLGVAVGAAEPGEARVRARVDGSRAVVETSLSVSWPMSIATVVAGVRRAVTDEVRRCTGLTVDHVDVEVVSLPAPVTRGTSRVA